MYYQDQRPALMSLKLYDLSNYSRKYYILSESQYIWLYMELQQYYN